MNKLLSLGWGSFPGSRVPLPIPFRDEKKDGKAKNWKTFWSGHLQHLLCSPLFTDFLEEYLGSLSGCVREVDNGRCMDTARPLQEPRVNTPRYQMEPLYTPL